MANLSDLEPHPDRYYRYDVPRSRPNSCVKFISYLIGILLALLILWALYVTITTGNQAVQP